MSYMLLNKRRMQYNYLTDIEHQANLFGLKIHPTSH